jgi:hypothetical protein
VTTKVARLLWTTALSSAVLVAACGGASKPITGTFTLTSSDVTNTATTCSGTGGYSDITDGLGVIVRDEAGKTIGTGSLTTDTAKSSSRGCAFTFTVPLTDDAQFYEVEVGHRGKITHSRAEMESSGWTIDLTLGQ